MVMIRPQVPIKLVRPRIIESRPLQKTRTDKRKRVAAVLVAANNDYHINENVYCSYYY
jgi:hypothetical protein